MCALVQEVSPVVLDAVCNNLVFAQIYHNLMSLPTQSLFTLHLQSGSDAQFTFVAFLLHTCRFQTGLDSDQSQSTSRRGFDLD